jgi:hypothetical protein
LRLGVQVQRGSAPGVPEVVARVPEGAVVRPVDVIGTTGWLEADGTSALPDDDEVTAPSDDEVTLRGATGVGVRPVPTGASALPDDDEVTEPSGDVAGVLELGRPAGG